MSATPDRLPCGCPITGCYLDHDDPAERECVRQQKMEMDDWAGALGEVEWY
ncbi:hypothetical protein ACWFPY_17650 [Nocardia fluminea]